MSVRYITTFLNPPQGFEKVTLSGETDLSGCVVIAVRNLDEIRAVMPEFERVMRGVIVTTHNIFSLRKAGEFLWHLEIPECMGDMVVPLAEGLTETVRESEILREQVATQSRHIEKLAAEMASVRNDYHDSVGRLTEQVNQVTALKDELQVIFEASQSGIILVDAKGIITYANRRMADMLHCDMEELIGSAYPDCLHPDEKESGSDRMRKLITGEIDNVHVERHYLRRDRTDFWGLLSGRRYVDTEGKLIALVGIIADITDRKLATEALRESEKKLQTMLEANPSPVVAYNADGFPEYLNPAFVELFGWTMDEVKGRHLPFIPDDEKERTRQITRELYATKKQVEFEARRLTKSGEVLDVIIRAAVLTNEADVVTGIIVTFTDITGKKKIERELRENESMLHATFEAVPDPMVIYDTQGFPRYLNPAFAELFGWTQDELKGRRIPFVPEEEKEKSAAVIRNVYATGKDGKFETRRYTKDGRTVDIVINGALVTDQKGNPTGMVVTLTDVTENKRIERELRESEERFRITALKTGELIYDYDVRTGNIVWAGAIEQLTGFSDEEFKLVDIGAWETMIHPDDRAVTIQVLGDAMDRTGDFDLEYRFRRKDGSYIYVEDHGVFLTGRHGESNRMIGTMKDITERRLSEEALRMSQERYRTIIEQSSDAIFQGDPEGNFVVVNAAACELTGYSREELLGMNMQNLFSVDQIRKEPLRYDLLQTGITLTRERIITRKNGDPEDIEMSSKRLSNGTYLCVMRSIAERKRAENERIEGERRMLHSQKLESLGVLAGGIAHDFNNLLMAIIGNLDLAQLRLPASSSALDNLKNAGKAAMRAADLTRQMLAYSGKGTFVTKRIDVNDLVLEMTHLLKASISKNITFILSLGKDIPVIDADVAQLQQVIMNLIVNASEAIGDNAGSITLSTGFKRHEQKELNQSRISEKLCPGMYVNVTVTDTGCGMDEQTRQRLFEPFFTTKFTGRGLGMAAVQGIIQSHKGAIMLDSEPGRGSRFTILFPAAQLHQQASDAAAPGEATPNNLFGGTVLVVDDEPEVLNLCVNMLTHIGMSTLTAADGVEAVDVFRNHADEIDCVLLDLMMPRMDGPAAFEHLRAIRSDAKIILSSGYNHEDVSQRFTGRKIDGFIQKPYTISSLRDTIGNVLNRRVSDR